MQQIILEGKSGMALNRRRSKWLIFRLTLPVPYTAYPSKWSYDSQNWGWFNPRSWVIQWRIPAIGRIEFGNFFGRTIALRNKGVIDWLIEWVQLAPAVDHSPVLNRPCLRAWTQLTYFFFFSQFSLPSSLYYEQNLSFRSVSKRPREWQ